MPVWDEEEDGKAKKVERTPKQRLLGWVLGKVPDVPVNNFTTDWNDGRAIGALVDGIAPGIYFYFKVFKVHFLWFLSDQ